jgi:regulator of protease activity HflC (stomatin/prohibitin superfamily)
VRVEIQRVDPPPDVMSAMHEVMKAERTRRAIVTEAQGAREASITRAEGEKQSAILSADGEAAATRAMADAESYRQLTVAAGEAEALTNVLGAIKAVGVTPEVLALKWFEALQVMSQGEASKIYLPNSPDGMASSIASLAERVKAPEPAPVSRRSAR